MTKYGAKRTEVGGVVFASRAEARRYQELRLLEAGGAIRDLELQPRYPLIVNGVTIGQYIGDFRYVDVETGETVTEDVKGGSSGGTRTAVYRLKKKIVEALYDVDITEVQA